MLLQDLFFPWRQKPFDSLADLFATTGCLFGQQSLLGVVLPQEEEALPLTRLNHQHCDSHREVIRQENKAAHCAGSAPSLGLHNAQHILQVNPQMIT